ncbi:MAG TPA: ThiF family adenylyltransferase [Kofleriaceae bacterium]|nr:ThiF family adenylyltransferase [Kofleriaceae bacterium]
MSPEPARRATVVGAGGLGGPIALALAAGGFDVTVCDPDVVELSNLHRQIAFGTADLGHGKAERLVDAIARHRGRGRAVAARFDRERARALTEGASVIVDGSDDPATKFLVADTAGALGVPYVIASAVGVGGNVFVGGRGTACYRCLFEDVPGEAPSCADAGVLGPLVSWIGGTAARFACRAADRGEAGGFVWIVDDLRRQPRTVALARRPGCGCEAWP